MMFLDTGFLLFILLAVPAFHLVPRRFRHHVIVVSGILFYTYNAGWWVLLFFSELLISRFYSKGSRACFLGVIQALVVLGIFKYGSFFEDVIRSVMGVEPGRMVHAFKILPLAISFFTFEFISYALDVRSGKINNASFIGYGAFIFFFPTLVAGPIKRFADFESKLEQATFKWDHIEHGITRILIGFFKKLAIADCLFKWTQNLNANSLDVLTGSWVWQSVFAYGLRIYFDFSGYADIAIGTALLFGIVVPENFNNPYAATNISTFWKNWHISLYRWLVDYIFIPLGGSWGGFWQTCRNILIVTFISGLWHGASWNFILWGCYHGVLLCGYHAWQKYFPSNPDSSGILARFKKVGSWALTLLLVMFGWTFFALDTSAIPMALQKMFFIK